MTDPSDVEISYKGTQVIDLEQTGIAPELAIKTFISYRFKGQKRRPFLVPSSTRLRPRAGKGLPSYGTDMFFPDLYHHLVKNYNNKPFIESYFNMFLKSHFQDRMIEIEEYIQSEVQKEVSYIRANTNLTKKGKQDKRRRGYKNLKTFGVWKSNILKFQFNQLAREIKKDIIRCLEIGKIPLSTSPKESTIRLREEVGIDSKESFFATGQLINSIIIQFKMEVESVSVFGS